VTKTLTLEQLQEIIDNPTTSPANREKALRIVEQSKETAAAKRNNPSADRVRQPATASVPPADFLSAFAALDKKATEIANPETPETAEKPRVTENLTESRQWAADASARAREQAQAEKAEAEAKALPPRPHSVQRPETIEEAQRRLWREKRAASIEWHRSMGLTTTAPEWPNV